MSAIVLARALILGGRSNLDQCFKSRTHYQTANFVQACTHHNDAADTPWLVHYALSFARSEQAESHARPPREFAIRNKYPFVVFLLRVVGSRVASNVVWFFGDSGEALDKDGLLVPISCLELAICLCFSHLLEDLHGMLVTKKCHDLVRPTLSILFLAPSAFTPRASSPFSSNWTRSSQLMSFRLSVYLCSRSDLSQVGISPSSFGSVGSSGGLELPRRPRGDRPRCISEWSEWYPSAPPNWPIPGMSPPMPALSII